MLRRLSLCLLSTALLLSLLLFATSATDNTRSIKSGSCGENATWSFDTETGALVISGSGALTAYSYGKTPWYSYRATTKSVTVSQGITELPTYAFQNSPVLESVSLPAGLTSIPSNAFYRCTQLAKVVLPEGVTSIGSYAFYGCTSLDSVHFPATLSKLDNQAFYNCSALNTLTIAEGCKDFAIQGGNLYDAALTTLLLVPADQKALNTLPESLTTFAPYALYNCSALTSIHFPDNAVISTQAITYCSTLQQLTVNHSNPNYQSIDGVLFSKDGSLLHLFPNGRSGSYTVPDSVTTIGTYAFCRAGALTEVKFPSGLTTIDDYAFSYCSSLKTAAFPEGLRRIDLSAFSHCSSLQGMVLPQSLTYLGTASFEYCKSLTELNIPPKIYRVNSCAFYQCSKLKKVVIESELDAIENQAFSYCTELESINLPDSIYFLSYECFAECPSLKSVRLPASLDTMGNGVFRDCTALESVVFGEEQTVIRSKTFQNCTSLKQVSLPESLTQIESSAFENSGLETILLHDKLTKIDAKAFKNCLQLKHLHFTGAAPTVDATSFSTTGTAPTALYPADQQGWTTPEWNGLPSQVWEWVYFSTADCTTEGQQGFRCSHCTLSFSKPQKALGHDYDDWKLTTPPTEDAEGLFTRSCLRCGHSDTESTPALPIWDQEVLSSSNKGDQHYNLNNWSDISADVIRSYWCAGKCGGFLRVEATTEGVWVEEYDENYQFLRHTTLPMELPLFGGFYEGTDDYFLAFGQTNSEEDDNKEVLRIVRYTKDGYRLGHASLYGGHTILPFYAGTLRMVQYGDFLYVHTARQMYTASDGKNHQANLRISIHIPGMDLTEETAEAIYTGYGYVSHSFNQFVIIDEGRVVALNHGDGYPRALEINQYTDPAGQEGGFLKCVDNSIYEISGDMGDNYTGVTVGGFEASSTHYITAATTTAQDTRDHRYNGQRNMILILTPKEGFSSSTKSTILPLTSYKDDVDDVNVSTPHLIKLESDRFCLLWTEDGQLRYAFLDGQGKLLTQIYETPNACLSDCKPMIYKDRLCWYVTKYSTPIFYTLSLTEPNDPEVIYKPLTLTLIPQGGSLEETALTIRHGYPYGTLPTPQRKAAYTFLGWYSSKTSGKLYTEDMIVEVVGDQTLYGHWELQEHDCDFILTGRTPGNCSKPATLHYECSLCDATKTEASKDNDHSYGLDRICTLCGKEGFSLNSSLQIYHSLNLASDISINYLIPEASLADYDSFYLLCRLPNYQGNDFTEYSTVLLQPQLRDGYYRFTLTDLHAGRMNDTVRTILVGQQGEQFYRSSPDEYSIAAYAYAQLKKEDVSQAFKTLCADLLRYGAWTQTYKSYRTDALADDAMTDAQKQYLTDTGSVTFGDHNRIADDLSQLTLTWAGRAMALNSKITLRFMFDATDYKGDLSSLQLKLSYTTANGTQVTATVTDPVAYAGRENSYVFDYDGLLAAELRCVVSAAIYEGDTQLSPTLYYSADTYGNNKEGALLSLCKALFAYSDSAKAYFAQ